MTSYPARFHAHPAALVGLPEYHEVRAALDRFAHANFRADGGVSQEALIAIAGDMASTNVYADMCDRCKSLGFVYPHRTKHSEGGLRGYYVCPVDGHRWTCWWAFSAPSIHAHADTSG
jgi:hypothetical protein